MTPESFNWRVFKHGIIVSCSAETLYNYIATERGIIQWFVGEANYSSTTGLKREAKELIQTADTYHWKWKNKDFECTGEILKAQKNECLHYSFGSTFQVKLSLSERGIRTQLSLEQTYLTLQQENQFGFLNCCVCWVFFLTNLKSVIESGVDLRETEVSEEWLVNI